MRFSNLKVGTRLALGFGVVLLGTLLVAAAAWYAVRTQSNATAESLDVHVRYVTWVLQIRAQLGDMRRIEKELVINASDVDEIKRIWQSWQAAVSGLNGNVQRAASVAGDAESSKRIEKLVAAIAGYGRGVSALHAELESRQIKNTDEANNRVDAFRTDFRAADAAMTDILNTAMQKLDETRRMVSEVEQRMIVVLLFAVLAAIAVAALLAVLTTRTITGPVEAAVRISKVLARGDLAQQIEVRSNDELGQLMAALKSTVEQLNGIVRDIKTTSDSVGAAAREISQGHSDLSTRTEEQASSLEQTAASMEQMTATVSQNAENAKKASQHASAASDVAQRGGQAMGAVVSTMSEISASSKKIADIIGVIDGIAFQTNILALNAAVEAARAGEQGRGFAVVASEVRSLAQRSAAAAKEIRLLIANSVGRIEAGSNQVEAAGETMAEIVAAVKRVNGLILEISAASQEQSQSLTQVSDTVQQLEKVTQQNAAMVEQATAASASLEEQASALTRAVGGFKLADDSRAAMANPPPARAQTLAVNAESLPQRVEKPAPELNAPRKRAAGGKANEGWEEF